MNASAAASNPNDVISILKKASLPLNNSGDLDALLDYIGDARFVLLGEASHGTHEYYTWRMQITKRLLEEKEFSFIAVEGDWPDCYQINRFVKNYPDAAHEAYQVLHAFNRWPTWMWANWEMVAFIEWLKNFNQNKFSKKRVGFYGLDVYSLWESIEAILSYLEKHDKIALDAAKKVLECFEPYRQEKGQSYGRPSAFLPELCQKEVTRLLTEIRSKIAYYNSDPENVFSTEQNALVAVNAEKYYRTMIRGGIRSWNIRDQHMTLTLERLMKFHGPKAKAIVWEHNTHIGDARATNMASEGMVNVGQLVNEKFFHEGVVLVGFGSYKGSVIAGRHWGDVMRRITVPNAMANSWEHLYHEAAKGQNQLLLMNKVKTERILSIPIAHRAIGVVYNPEYENLGNYVKSILPKRYDAFIFLDETQALHPLHIESNTKQIPETFPFGV